jgi:hypothetical protein
MLAVAAALALACRSLEAQVYHDVWNASAPVLPFALLVFVAWSVAAGDHWLLPAMVVVASFVAQAQLTYLLPSLALVAVAVVVWLVRPHGKRPTVADTERIDTTKVGLDTLQANLPPPEPDTFARVQPTPEPQPTRRAIPEAPDALMAAVEREKDFTQFCYEEVGLKTDPTLRGGVAFIVTVGASGITGARIASDNWTSGAGKAVNRCLNERARQAWKLKPGEVKAGQYRVPMTFRPA